MSSSFQKPTKLFNPMFVMLFVISSVSSIAFSMINPIMTKYALSIGADNTTAGMLAGVASVISIVVRPVSGALSDRVNKKTAVLIFSVIGSLAVFGYSAINTVTALFVVRIIHGICFSFKGTMTIVMGTLYIPDDRRGEGMAYLALPQTIGQIIGPGIGLKLIEISYQFCYIVAATILLISSLSLIFLSYQEDRTGRTARKVTFRSLIAIDIFPVIVYSALICMANGLSSTFIAVLAEENGVKGVSLFFSINAAAVFIMRPVFGKLSDRVNVGKMVVAALLCCGTAMVLAGAAKSIVLIVVSALLKAGAVSMGLPTIQAECIRRLPKERTGVAISTYYMGGDIGNGIAATVGGVVADATGNYASIFFSYGVVAAIACVGAGLYFKYGKAYRNKA